jgi:hypothetical protein
MLPQYYKKFIGNATIVFNLVSTFLIKSVSSIMFSNVSSETAFMVDAISLTTSLLVKI